MPEPAASLDYLMSGKDDTRWVKSKASFAKSKNIGWSWS
jgi:hypothetical protein